MTDLPNHIIINCRSLNCENKTNALLSHLDREYSTSFLCESCLVKYKDRLRDTLNSLSTIYLFEDCGVGLEIAILHEMYTGKRYTFITSTCKTFQCTNDAKYDYPLHGTHHIDTFCKDCSDKIKREVSNRIKHVSSPVVLPKEGSQIIWDFILNGVMTEFKLDGYRVKQ